MNVRIFWVRAMKCTCAQTRPRFILSSERVLGGMEFEPMLTPREKSPQPEISPEEDRTRDTVDSEPKHYQWAKPWSKNNSMTVPWLCYDQTLLFHDCSRTLLWPICIIPWLCYDQTLLFHDCSTTLLWPNSIIPWLFHYFAMTKLYYSMTENSSLADQEFNLQATHHVWQERLCEVYLMSLSAFWVQIPHHPLFHSSLTLPWLLICNKKKIQWLFQALKLSFQIPWCSQFP